MKRIHLALIAALAIGAAAISYDATAGQVFPRPTVLIEDVADGKLVTLGPTSLMVLSVEGQATPAGTNFALDGNRGSVGRVIPFSGAIRGGPVDWTSVAITVDLVGASLPTQVENTGDLSVGEVAVQGGNLWMKANVFAADGSQISPGAGNVWAVKLNGGTSVQAVADDISVTRVVGAFRGFSGS